MPLETSLNSSPYFDDYDSTKEFYKILFKPSVAVQTRELNQLQTLLQSQIERFGNHVFKSGTIVSGVNFSYLPNYSYVKILDTQTDGQPSVPSAYVNLFARSTANLQARVVNYEDGFESKSPDLKTLYLQYINTGTGGNTAYAPSEQITLFDKNYKLFDVQVNNGGLGFSNADTLIITSAITVSGNTGAFANGENIVSAGGANLVITAINTTAIANTIILQVRPQLADLSNTSVTASAWTLVEGENITSDGGAVGTVASLIGSGATGTVITDSLGVVLNVTLSENGSDYVYAPTAYLKTSNTSATLNNLDFEPLNYKTTVTVANSTVNAIGTGYAFAVSSGIIYQKGYFLTVDPQVIVIDKYSTTPDDITVGFKTTETVVDAFADETLYDNASGTTNYTAPGADRLKLTPVLYTANIATAAANVDFFTLAEWKEGFPYKENKVTVYSNLADELARRTREAQGDFVVDTFNVLSKEKSTANTTHIQAVIDPGTAYIQGYRVSTTYNNYLDLARETTTASAPDQSISFNYGNYIIVNELAGLFNFKAGDQIRLYDTVKQYVTNATVGGSGAITPAGTLIGYARIRSLVLNSGYPGTPGCTYRMYLFDVAMNAGKSFRNVKSVYYDGTTFDGIADLVLTYDASTGSNVAAINDVNKSALLFPIGKQGVSAVSNVSYQYRTVSSATLQLTTGGTLTIGPLASGSEFPYSDGTLSAVQKRDVIVFPTANATAAANISGSVTISGNTVTGTSTSFASEVKVGDFVKFTNTSATSVYVQVTNIANNTQMSLSTSPTIGGSANGVLFYPALYPLSLEDRTDRTVTISGTSSTLALNINKSLSSTVNAIAVYTVKNIDAAPVDKTATRNLYVKLHTSNNSATNLGPWSLGIPGVFRLKNVYLGSSSTVNTNSTDVTKYFYVDVGDDESAYRSSRLVLRSGGGLTLDTNSYLLAKVDAFTNGGTEGYFSVESYTINDSANLASLSTSVNTLEIPETLTRGGQYFDLRDTIDFRPYGTATANLSTTVAGATINPSSTFALSGDDQFFPLPDSSVTFDASYYMSRIDRVVAKTDNTFEVVSGDPSATNPVPPKDVTGAITLARLRVPPYPSLPQALNSTTLEIASKKIGSDRGTIEKRIQNFTVTPYTEVINGVPQNVQPRRYTMKDIGKLERRVNNVENAVALNDLEKQIAAKNIPSQANPNQNRFKNGFFVEPFDNYLSADTGNREFAATIDQERSVLKPPTRQVNFESSFDLTHANTAAAVVNGTLMLPYVLESFIDQSIKSSIVSSDGVQVAFNGTVAATPASFSIQSRGEVTLIPDPPPVNTGGGVGGDGGGWTDGGGGGDGGGGKVICTALYQLGHLERDIFEWDQKFGLWLQKNDWVAYKGYRLWADILVDFMHGRREPFVPKLFFWKTKKQQREMSRNMALALAKALGKPFAYELARRYGQHAKFSLFGWAIVSVGLKICKTIGYFHQRARRSNDNKAGV